MNYPTPNHLVRNHDGYTSFNFGLLHSVTPMVLCPHPHVDLRFVGGLKLELTPLTVRALSLQLPGAVVRLGFIPDVHDAIGLGDEGVAL